MIAQKNRYIFGGILIGLIILITIGIGMLALLLDELGEEGHNIAYFASTLSLPLLGVEVENEGNEFTGQLTGWIFGTACLPVAINLTARLISQKVSLKQHQKGWLERISRLNLKYLMPFHTYLSILAFSLAITHYFLSSCLLNPLPEWGLIGTGILVVTGLIFKLRLIPKAFSTLIKWNYKFHASLVVSLILLSILLSGHILMD
jgi:hypothetical protein